MPDLNGDRINELLFVTAFGPHMGEFSEDASIVTVADKRLRTFLDIEDVLFDLCTTVDPAATTVAWRLRAQLGARPIFTLDRYAARCQDQTRSSAKFVYQYSKRVLADTP